MSNACGWEGEGEGDTIKWLKSGRKGSWKREWRWYPTLPHFERYHLYALLCSISFPSYDLNAKSWCSWMLQTQMPQISCRKKDKDKGQNHQPYKVIEITPPPKNLGIRCFPSVSIYHHFNCNWFVYPDALLAFKPS